MILLCSKYVEMYCSRKFLRTSYEPQHNVIGTIHWPSPWVPLAKNRDCHYYIDLYEPS